ncbi:MAG TPA: S9 family peptidase [Gammaproteobacteria bacterium]|nr:S9 family peptidase [Gammaproteobacteria bacterium]
MTRSFRFLPAAVLGLSLTMTLSAPAQAEKLDFERVHADPPLAGASAQGLQVAPDGARVTFLQPRAANQDMLDLWQIETGSGERSLLLREEDLVDGAVELTPEEEARRQRLRIRAGGITNYSYDDTGGRLLIPLAGNLYIYEFATGNVISITGGEARLDPKLSPSGTHVAFVRGRDLWVRDLNESTETRLTDTGSESIVNGLAEFIAQEEMGRYEGFWWSPDSRRIAFIEYDETAVHVLERVAIGGDGATLTEQRYPLAGSDNVSVRVGIVEIDTGDTQWAELGTETDIYIARVQWNDAGSRLLVQRQPRSQQRLDLLGVDPRNGRANVLLSETASSWINLHDDLHPLPGGDFLWTSERSGFRHIYLYDAAAREAVPLTRGEWLVDDIACVDTAARQVYFTGWREDPRTANLYRVSLSGETPERPQRVSRRDGWHAIAAATDCSIYVDTFSAPDQPPQVSLHERDGTHLTWIIENALDDDHPYAPYLDTHVVREAGSLQAEDGATLYYNLYRPSDFDPQRTYPAIVLVYGGPRAQRVRHNWGPLQAQVYADAGFVVFMLDNRGSYRRGVEFESGLHGLLGEIETRDQLTGIRMLGELSYVDADRIGVQGWSYGGYMTVMLLAKGGDLLAAGSAGAPVTDWLLYDTHYTERYLMKPQDNGQGYERSSVFPYLSGMSGALQLVHGMADDNVFFTNSTKLMQALQQANQPFELMTYPGETHFIRNRAARLHSDEAALRFFERELRPER